MMVDWLNVDTCFGAKKWACGSSYPLFLCVPNHMVWYAQCLWH